MYQSDSDEDLVLTQTSSKKFDDTPSCNFGSDIVDEVNETEEQGVVSLEGPSGVLNFDVGYQLSQPISGKRIIYDRVEIEDITSDEELDGM